MNFWNLLNFLHANCNPIPLLPRHENKTKKVISSYFQIFSNIFRYFSHPPWLIPCMFCRAFCILSRQQNALQNINCWNSLVSQVILSYKTLPEPPTECHLLTILTARCNKDICKKDALETEQNPKWFRSSTKCSPATSAPFKNNPQHASLLPWFWKQSGGKW